MKDWYSLLLVLVSCLPFAFAADRTPIQAGLVRTLDVADLRVDDAVFAKVSTKWQSPECDLREGAVLKGRVVGLTVHSKTSKTSDVSLLFDTAECGGPVLKPLPLTIAAVMAGDPRRDRALYESQPLSDAVGLMMHGNSRSLSSASSTVFVEPQRYKGPTSVRPGEVAGIKGIQLRVGSGPQGSSVLLASGHNLRLDSGTVLVLVPNRIVTNSGKAPDMPNAPSASNPHAESKLPEALEPVDETEVCSPPNATWRLGSTTFKPQKLHR